MPRSVKQIQDAVEKKKLEIIRLEAAVVAAESAEEMKRDARQFDHQAMLLGRTLLAPDAPADIKALQKRLLDMLTDTDRSLFDGPPVEPQRTPRKPKSEAEAPKPTEPAKTPPGAA